MKTVEINGVSLTEEQVLEAYKKLQESALQERCTEGYGVFGNGSISSFCAIHDDDYRQCFALYPTVEAAEKASKLMKESNKLIMACMLVDPDYEPDWDDSDTEKHSVDFDHNINKYAVWSWVHRSCGVAHVSTREKAAEAVKLLESWKDE